MGWEWSLSACYAYVWWMGWGLMSSPILWLAMAAVTYVVPPPVLARAGRDLLGVVPRRIVMPAWVPRRPDVPGRAVFFVLVAALAHNLHVLTQLWSPGKWLTRSGASARCQLLFRVTAPTLSSLALRRCFPLDLVSQRWRGRWSGPLRGPRAWRLARGLWTQAPISS